jgi:lipoate-protein ligase A
MYQLDITLDAPAANIALDEALLEWAEDQDATLCCEVLRLWEPRTPLVVVGRSSRVDVEVNLPACRELKIPVVRRPSGGAAIVTGPGCLMYAVVLDCNRRPELRAVDRAHQFVLERTAQAARSSASHVEHAGTSDLICRDPNEPHVLAKKFSGNSLRIKRTHLLYHGTILVDFDLSLISQCLRMPPRQPDYRDARPHDQFVTNLSIDVSKFRLALARVWQANEPLEDWPHAKTQTLVEQRYGRDDWNQKL